MKHQLSSTRSFKNLFLSSVLLLIAFSGFSQLLSEKSTRTISFTTDEGTNMSVDVSPDGKTLVFDLLGSLYTVSITGGRAVPLINGTDWVEAPKFSPDGKQIAFISDRGNVNNLWVVELKSKKIRQLTKLVDPHDMEDYGVYGTPAWFDEGNKIACLQWPRGINAVSIATGNCLDLDGKADFFSSPVFSPDGKEIISSNYDKGQGRQKLMRFSLKTSIITPLESVESRVTSFTAVNTGEMKPVLSRSGRYLAYLRTTEPSIGELRVRDLKTGADRRLMSLPDLLRNWSFQWGRARDGYPGYAITPDEKDVVIWSRGKLFRVSLTGGDPRLIPFIVEVKKQVSIPLRAHYRISDDSLKVKSIRWPLVTADGKKMIFSAVGSLWKMDLPNSSPVKITNSEDLEIMPALSPNGKELAYIASDLNGGQYAQRRLMIYNMKTDKTVPVLPPDDSASYLLPSWSPDGSKIAVVRQSKSSNDLDYGWLNVSSKQFHRVASYPSPEGIQEYVEPMHIVFAENGEELLYIARVKEDPYKLTLCCISLDGNNSRDLLTTADPSVTAIYPCPDKKKAFLLGWDYEGYLTELTPAGDSVQKVSIFDLNKKKTLKLISKGGALYPRWSGDNKLTYGWLKSIYQYQVEGKTSHPLTFVALTVPRRGNQGIYALYNARVITMSGRYGAGKVLENATIVVRDRRIIAVGPVAATAIPTDAVVIDASGKTIMPGLIDGHGHGIGGNLFLPVWNNAIRDGMSYGFTTILDAATNLNDDTGLSDMELLEAGKIRGVRCFSTTGFVSSLYFWTPGSGVKYRSYEEVRNQVRRRIELGAEQCLKQKLGDSYRQFSRWMARAVREAGVSAISHIQEPHEQLLSRACDGYSVDHPGLYTPSYRDVIEFMSRTGSIWTVHHTMGSLKTSSLKYFDEDLEYATMFQRLSRQRKDFEFQHYPSQGFYKVLPEDMVLLETTRNAGMARLATQINDAGGKIVGGSRDGDENVTNHFELWEFRRQGMPPGDVLRTATMIPAEKLGIQADVGSIEPGKLADMLILNGNPLERIESTLDIKYTILAGDIYDPETLKVIPPKELSIKR